MKNKFKHIIKEAKRSTLQKEEKSQIRETLFSFMQENPVRKEDIIRHQYQQPNILVSMFLSFRGTAIVALLLIIVVGGGVGYAAEDALPGDALYSVKVHVNEEISGLLAFSQEEKADWQIQRVERRLKETEKLALQGSLNKQISETITVNFENHVNDASQHIAVLEAQGDVYTAEDLNSRLESSLRAHEKVFEVLVRDNEAVETVFEEVSQQIDTITNTGIQIEEKISQEVLRKPNGTSITEEKFKSVTNDLLKARQAVAEINRSLGPESVVHAEQQLELAENIIDQGNAKIDSDELQEAFSLFQKAEGIIKVTNVVVEISTELQITIPVEESIIQDSDVETLPEPDIEQDQEDEDKTINR